MTEYEMQLQNMMSGTEVPGYTTPDNTPKYSGTSKIDDKLQNMMDNADKLTTVSVAKSNKELELRKDTVDYGDDNWLVESAKSFANEFLPHEMQLAVNKDGKRYTTENKTFNEDDLSNVWNKYQDDPAGDKTLYYLRKQDPVTGQYVYKPGIAHVSAADRYKTQYEASGWELLGEKRFNEASAVEKQIHGNKAFLESRVYDYGTTGKDGATNIFGAGKTELYSKDILGLDTGTKEDYAKNMQDSIKKMVGLIKNDRQKEDAFEFVDAFQAGGINLAGGALKLIGEAVSTSEGDGVIEAFGKRLQKDANRMAGYNPKAAAEAEMQLKDTWEKGDVLGYLGAMASGSPQWLAQSLPNMAAFAATSTATSMATGNPITGLMAGSALMGAVRANDILDDREKLMDRKATSEEIASIYATSSVLSLLEYGALKYAMTGKGLIGTTPKGETVDLGKKLFDTDDKIVNMAITLGEQVGKRGKGALAEGSEEVVAGLTEFMMTNYGTKEYNGVSVADMLTSDKARDIAVVSFGAGAGAGGLANIAVEGTTDLYKAKVADRVQQTAEKKTVEDIVGETDVDSAVYKEAASEIATVLKEAKTTGDIETLNAKLDEISAKYDTPDIAEVIDTSREKVTADIEATKIEDYITTKQTELEKQLSVEERAVIEADIMQAEKRLEELRPVIAEDKAIQEKLDLSGMSQFITKEDKEAGLGVEMMQGDPRVEERGGKKEKAYEAFNVDEQAILEIMTGKFTKESMQRIAGNTQDTQLLESTTKKLSEGSKEQTKIAEVAKEVEAKMAEGKGQAELAAISPKDTSHSRMMRILSIVAGGINSAIPSEYDIQTNKNVDASDVDYIRASNVREQLGKEYANSFGLKFAGSPQATAKKYAELGTKMLDLAVAMDIVTIEEALVPTIDVVDPTTGAKLTEVEHFTSRGMKAQKGTDRKGRSTIMVAEPVVRLTDNTAKGREPNSKIGQALNVLAELFQPRNVKLPSADVSTTEIPVNQSISEDHLGIIKALQELEYKIKPKALEMFMELKQRSKSYDSMDQFLATDSVVKDLLDSKSRSQWLVKSSDKGKNIDRKRRLREVLDNLEVLPDKFHYSYESAINQRIHVMETILEFQGDKYMARQVLTGETYTTDSAKNAEVLIENVAEELYGGNRTLTKEEAKVYKNSRELDMDRVTTAGKDTDLDAFIDEMKANDGKLSIEDYLYASKVLGISSPFKAMSLLDAVYDIRTAKDKTKITTDYMVEFDMTASGVINTLMNLAGIPAVQKVLNKLLKGETDPYNHLKEVMMSKKAGAVQFTKEITPILDKLANIGISGRNIAKSPIMTWFYGSIKSNVQANMSKDITIDILNKQSKEAAKIVNDILGENKYKDNTLLDITRDDFDKVASYYEENLAKHYVNALEQAFPGVKEYRNSMEEVYKVLEKTGKWEGEIGTAMAALENTPTKNKMSVKKKKASMAKVDEGVFIPVNEMYNNMKSFFVNLQHSSDAAQLLTAISKGIKNAKAGLMTVHDAIYGSANRMLGLKDIYEGQLKDTALKYDYLQTAINEAKEAISKMEVETAKGRENKAKLEAQIAELEATNKETMKAKAEYLKDKKTNFFGTKAVKLEEEDVDVTVEGEVKKEVKPKVVVEEKATPFKGVMTTLQNVIKSKDMKAVAEELDKLEVSEKYVELKAKIVAAIKDGKVDVLASNKYEGGYNEIYADTTKTVHPETKKELTADTLVEMLAHEVDHAVHFSYITENMSSSEIKYIKKAIAGIVPSKAANPEIRSRLEYIINPKTKIQLEAQAKKTGKTAQELKEIYQVSEFVSIMRNESAVYEYINELENGKGIIGALKKLINAIKEWAKNASVDSMKAIFSEDTEVTFANTLKSLETVDKAAKIYNMKVRNDAKLDRPAMSKKQQARAQRDINIDAYMNPMKYAEGIVARQNSYLAAAIDVLGGAIIDIASPGVLAAHKKFSRFAVYADTVKYIRHGLRDSTLAKKMRDTIGYATDIDEKVMNDMLQMGNAISQEMRTYETDNLPDLDNRIQKMYPDKKDQVTVYQIFAKTGIAGLQHNTEIVQGIINGTMTIQEAIDMMKGTVKGADLDIVKEVAKYYVTGMTRTGNVNLRKAGVLSKNAEVLVALEALMIVENGQELLQNMPVAMRRELYGIAISTYALHNEINLQEPGYEGKAHTDNPMYDVTYDGHYSMDVLDAYEFKMTSKGDMLRNKFPAEEDWIVIQEPSVTKNGIVARSMTKSGNTPGIGLNSNRYKNGFYLDKADSDTLKGKLGKLTEADAKEYLLENNILDEGHGRYRMLLSEKVKAEKLGMEQSVAHSLWRTYTHNAELVAMQTVRDMVTEKATQRINNNKEMEVLSDKIAKNSKLAHNKKEILPMFLNITYDYESYENLPVWIKKEYMAPRNVSTYNNFHKKITLVKKGQSDVLLGHPNFSLFGENGNRLLSKLDAGWKMAVVAAKQKMAVAAPAKLLGDIISNFGILGMKDVSLKEIYDGMKEGITEYNRFSRLRGEAVQLEFQHRLGVEGAKEKLAAKKKEIENDSFYDAFKAGFVQSYSTSLVIKDFDTISGLQKTMDDVITELTTDKKGNPNEIHKAIKWWQNFGAAQGFTVDSLLMSASKLSVMNKTSISEEMVNMSKRLKSKREAENVSRYVGELLGGPASEAMAIGGAVMVTADVISKYILAKSLLNRANPRTENKRKYTKDEAYMEANNTFIDYRRNIPSELKALSDYGILLFPAFWIKAQKIILGLAHYHPATAIGGYMIADALDMSSASFLDENIVNRITDGTIINNPANIVDWSTLSPWLD